MQDTKTLNLSRNKLITQGEKRETSIKNLKRDKFRVFISRISLP